jgi:hypothetical protein
MVFTISIMVSYEEMLLLMMSINETNNGNEQEEIISPYQMFLMYIRSPMTVKEYSITLTSFLIS